VVLPPPPPPPRPPGRLPAPPPSTGRVSPSYTSRFIGASAPSALRQEGDPTSPPRFCRRACAHEKHWSLRHRLTASSGAALKAATRVGALSGAGGAPRQHSLTQRVVSTGKSGRRKGLTADQPPVVVLYVGESLFPRNITESLPSSCCTWAVAAQRTGIDEKRIAVIL